MTLTIFCKSFKPLSGLVTLTTDNKLKISVLFLGQHGPLETEKEKYIQNTEIIKKKFLSWLEIWNKTKHLYAFVSFNCLLIFFIYNNYDKNEYGAEICLEFHSHYELEIR